MGELECQSSSLRTLLSPPTSPDLSLANRGPDSTLEFPLVYTTGRPGPGTVIDAAVTTGGIQSTARDGRYAVLFNADRLKPLIDAAMREKPVEVVLDIPGPWGRISQAYYDGFGGAWVVVARLSQTAFRSPVPNYGGLLDVALAKYTGMTLENYGASTSGGRVDPELGVMFTAGSAGRMIDVRATTRPVRVNSAASGFGVLGIPGIAGSPVLPLLRHFLATIVAALGGPDAEAAAPSSFEQFFVSSSVLDTKAASEEVVYFLVPFDDHGGILVRESLLSRELAFLREGDGEEPRGHHTAGGGAASGPTRATK